MVIGAWAVGVWGRPRATMDLDFMVMPGAAEIDRLGARMARHGFTVDEQWLEWNPMLRGSQLRLWFGPITVDVLCPHDDHDRQALRRRRARRWERHAYWFVAPEDLVLQKLKVGRPRDFEDTLTVLERSGARLNRAYLRRWATRLHITGELGYVLSL